MSAAQPTPRTAPEVPPCIVVRCGWCDGTGSVALWAGVSRVGEGRCCRCAGVGHIVVEGGSTCD